MDRDEAVRQSRRLKGKQRINYKDLHTGKNIIMNEGNTEVSQHMANEDHDREDVNFRLLGKKVNWYERIIKEAIEIRRRGPSLNQDTGKFYIPNIFNPIIKKKEG